MLQAVPQAGWWDVGTGNINPYRQREECNLVSQSPRAVTTQVLDTWAPSPPPWLQFCEEGLAQRCQSPAEGPGLGVPSRKLTKQRA